MFSSSIEEIKNRLDVAEVIGGYIKLQKAGANYRALCPFHSEKGPSFFVSPSRQIWHCFGCGSGGDVFRFVMQIEGVEFGDALRILAKRAGVEVTPEHPELRTERQRMYEICELSAKFFEKQLQASKTGQEAKEYLLGRGISEESIKIWRLGFAPEAWQGLSDFLVGRGYTREEIANAGLAIKSEKRSGSQSSYYDRFRNRIIFPVFDIQGQVVGFGGRVFGDSKRPDGQAEAKYINSPSTILYDKSKVLYGLNRAKVEIRKKNECILVEGYTDVIMSHQAGVENVVAVSGTALTVFQLRILKRYTENLLISFDMDIAGDTATKRGIDLAQLQGFNIKIITMTEDLDPADIISKDPKEWEKFVSNAKSILDFFFETTFAKFDKSTPEGKKAIAKILLPVIKRIPNKIESSFWVQSLSKKIGIKEEDVLEELNKVRIENSDLPDAPEFVPPPKVLKSRKEALEEKICSLALKNAEYVTILKNEDFELFSSQANRIFSHIREKLASSDSEAKVEFAVEGAVQENSEGDSKEFKELMDYLFLKSEVEDAELPESELRDEFRCCMKEIRCLEIKNKLDKISKNIKQAETEQDPLKLQELVKEFDFCSKYLRESETA